jgi:anti-sigma factor RsiW
MASLLHELENNEAMLLMFLTGELPEEDRMEVVQMLASDGGLRAELARRRNWIRITRPSRRKIMQFARRCGR